MIGFKISKRPAVIGRGCQAKHLLPDARRFGRVAHAHWEAKVMLCGSVRVPAGETVTGFAGGNGCSFLGTLGGASRGRFWVLAVDEVD